MDYKGDQVMKKLTRLSTTFLVLSVIIAFSMITASAAYCFDSTVTIYPPKYDYYHQCVAGDGKNLNITVYNTGTTNVTYILYVYDPITQQSVYPTGSNGVTITPGNRYVTTFYNAAGLSLQVTCTIISPSTTTCRLLFSQY